MKQAVMTAPGQIEIRDVDAPQPQAGEVLLRIRRIGVCGSDVHVNHGKHPYTSYPVVQGHEFAAEVAAIGEGVTGIAVGAKATATPQNTCGTCRQCRRGDYHICDALAVRGFQAPGCAQEYYVTPAEKVLLLPDDFTFEQGALVEPAAVAVHAMGRVEGGVDGRNVVVLGAGPIGNLVAQVARSEAAGVLITDLSDYRLEIARQCGLSATSNAGQEPLAAAVDRAFGPEGFDVAFECVGVEPTIAAAVECIQKGGTIVVVGVFGERPRVDLGYVQDRELSIRGTMMYKRADYEGAIERIASGGISTEPLISKHFPLDEYLAAYDFIDRAGDKTMKVLIDV
jgi:2-desacetyl-2-hydroxyethyl bacteriochlorophyllide A dehydrogenase